MRAKRLQDFTFLRCEGCCYALVVFVNYTLLLLRTCCSQPCVATVYEVCSMLQFRVLSAFNYIASEPLRKYDHNCVAFFVKYAIFRHAHVILREVCAPCLSYCTNVVLFPFHVLFGESVRSISLRLLAHELSRVYMTVGT